MENLAGTQNTKLLFGEKYPEKLQLLQLLISSTMWITHNQNVSLDVVQHVGIHERKMIICRPWGETGGKTSEFTWNICRNLKGSCSPGRAGDCAGCRAHPDTSAVSWRNPSQGSQVSRLKAGDTKPVGSNRSQVQIPKSVFHCDLGRSPESTTAHAGTQPLPRVLGTEWGREVQREERWCWSYWYHFHQSKSSKSLHAETKAWKKPSQHREPPKSYM